MSVGGNAVNSATETTFAPDGIESSENIFKKTFRRYFPLILILWILLVLYPNPLSLVVSIHRFINPAVNPSAVEMILDDFPSDPVAIEKAVLERISYRLDWELYGVP